MTGMSSEQQTCKECGGSGWILESSEGRKLARPCVCRAAASRQGKLENAGIPERYRQCSIAGFNDLGAGVLGKAKTTAREFVDRYPFVDAGLLFIGDSGL